jgi:hypothetical protein
MAQVLLDKIAKGETPTAEEIGKYKNICKALNAGIEAWKQDIENQFPAPRAPEIEQILANLKSYNTQLQDLLNCNGQGYLKYGRNSNELYASLSDAEPGFYFVACNYKVGQEAALKTELDIEAMDNLISKSIVVLLSGADIFGANHGINTLISEDILKEKYMPNQKVLVGRFISHYFHIETVTTTDPLNPTTTVITGGEEELDNDISESLKFILEKRKTNKDKIIILGYSWGGVLSMHLARRLNEKGFKIDLMVLLDAANGFYSDKVDRNIPNNVSETQNFYQENSELPIFGDFKNYPWSRGYPASGLNVLNLKVKKIGISHTNIDEEVYKLGISKTIIYKLK